MRTTVNKRDFIKAFAVGGAFAGKSKMLPILDCVKIKVKGETMNIVSTDSNNAVSKRMNVLASDGDFTFCVNASDLNKYVKLITDEFFDLVLAEDGNSVDVAHSKGSLTLPLMEVNAFPTMKMSDDNTEIEIDAALLNNYIVMCRDFVDTNEVRPVMCGINFTLKGGKFGCAATNGHLLVTEQNTVDCDKELSFILHSSTFTAVCNAISECENVKIRVSEKNTAFIGEGISLITKNIEARFPNVDAVIPKEYSKRMIADKNELMNAVRRCSFSSKGTNTTKFNLDNDRLEILANDDMFSMKSKEKVSVESDSEIEIGFNADMFIKAVSVINTDKVVIEMTDNTRPAVFKEDDADSNKIVLLTPMML